MRVLWIVNMVLPHLARHLGITTSTSGSWMEDISKLLSENENIELAVAAVGGSEYQQIKLDGISYYVLPGNGKTMLFYNKGLAKYWEKIYNDFQPDMVHLHGTEYTHGLVFLRRYPQLKAIVSIQGILTRIKAVNMEGMPKFSALRYRTFKEWLKFNGMFEQALLHKKNSKYEQEIIRRVKYANTVNFWDTSWTKCINPTIQCFEIDYNLREEFYCSPKWQPDTMERLKIFTNPSGVPLKGLHILLKALAIVKIYYPGIKLYVPGLSTQNNRLKVTNGYLKYIEKLIDQYQLSDNIVFLGRLNSAEMRAHMISSNAVVVASAIEGTSLVLREAMFLGVPCIASFRGGMADFIRDKESGFLYDFLEYPYLAYRIVELLGNDELADKFSKNAIAQAEAAHNREKNPKEYLSMYQTVYEDKS